MFRYNLALPTSILVLVTASCRQDMHNQPRYKPLSGTTFFEDGRASRPAIPDTVARGQLQVDSARYTGKQEGKDVAAFPIQITRADIVRGRERFDIFCSPCHSRLGDGEGLVVRRGLLRPPTFHDARLRGAPVGHFFDVITNGYGAMLSYASRIPVDDRWRIIAYIRALQLSQNASSEVPAGNSQAMLGARP